MSMAMEIPDFRAASVCLRQNAKLLKIILVISVTESNGRQVIFDYAIGLKQNCMNYKSFN